MGIEIVDQRFAFTVRDGGIYRAVCSREPAVLNRPAHLVGIFDGQDAFLYQDGKLQGQQRIASYRNSEPPFFIGCDRNEHGNPHHFFRSRIAFVQIASAKMYDREFAPPFSLRLHRSAVLAYPLNEGKGNIATDQSKNGMHGTIGGA